MSTELTPADVWTFTGYRPRAAELGRHTAGTLNPPERPQYQGVVFQDGSVAVRWHTDYRSTSVWATFGDFYRVHGHPEYGTVIVWDDQEPPTARAVREELEADMAARGVVPGARPSPVDHHAQLAEATGASNGEDWPELLERVRGLAGTAPEAIARARWASWRDQRGRSITDPGWMP